MLHDRSDCPRYQMGSLLLPPRGIKVPDVTVVPCQPSALEIAFADPDLDEGIFDPETATRFLLRPGSMVRVPQGNCCALDNQSEKVEAELTWTIVAQNVPDGVVEDAGIDSDGEGGGAEADQVEQD